MKTIFSPLHSRRSVKTELDGGLLIEPHEKPSRAETILARVKTQTLGEVLEPEEFGLEPVKRVHKPDYVEFLEHCWTDWVAEGKPGEAIPAVWCGRGMRARVPRDIDGRLGYYSFAAETSISDGTWEAARASANVALTAQRLVANGEGAGEGYNLNIVYPPGTLYSEWSKGLETACQRIADFKPDALIIALGVDTFEEDPISFFKLKSTDYLTLGARMAELGLPTVFTMEGGYDVDAIGVNVVNVLKGFENR